MVAEDATACIVNPLIVYSITIKLYIFNVRVRLHTQLTLQANGRYVSNIGVAFALNGLSLRFFKVI